MTILGSKRPPQNNNGNDKTTMTTTNVHEGNELTLEDISKLTLEEKATQNVGINSGSTRLPQNNNGNDKMTMKTTTNEHDDDENDDDNNDNEYLTQFPFHTVKKLLANPFKQLH